VAEVGPIRGSLQYSFDENNTVDKAGAATNPGGARKTAGGYLRYAANGLVAGAGYMTTKLPGGTKVDAWTLGGSYRTGPLYFNLGYGENERKDGYAMSVAGVIDSAVLNAMWTGSSNGGFVAGAAVNPAQPATMANLLNYADKRELITLGVGYQATKQLNLGAHYYHAKQSGSLSGAYNGKANFLVAAADYAFSKRTDAYFAIDHTKVSGGAGMALDANGAKSRTGITAGIRHRF
jgi:predicted porin